MIDLVFVENFHTGKNQVSGSGMKIRKATNDDIAVLSHIIQRSYQDVAERFNLTPENCPKHPSNCQEDWIQRDFQRGVQYFLMEDQKEVVGMVALEMVSPEVCYLERLSVLPHKRKNGFGNMLVSHGIVQAKKAGIQSMGIGIIAAQTELKEWYEQIGFVAGERKTFSHLPFQVLFLTIDLQSE